MDADNDRNDAVLAVFQAQIQDVPLFQTDELLAVEAPAGVGAPVRAFTVLAGSAALALVGVTVPSMSPQAQGFVGYIARRARSRRVPYLALSSQRETLLVRTPRHDGDALAVLRAYPTETIIHSTATYPLLPAERAVLADLALRVATDLLTLHREGQLDLVVPDADFFVARLTRAVGILKPAVKQALLTKVGMDPTFARDLEAWATPQGIPADVRSPDFAEAVVRQAIYRLLGKIIFYQSLRRAVAGLPDMALDGLDTSQVLPKLNACFAEAHKIDYHAVFREDVVDRLPYPAAASTELAALVADLNTRDFAHLPQDVVGAVFERLIPPEDRHALGQFFTPEPLVDLTAAFCIRRAEDKVLDPTCGTGTFLIRAYDRKRTALGLYDHNQQLAQLWGADIAPFPAELATINLFRQQVGAPGNFPRVLNEDFFEIVPGGRYRFPPLKAEPGETANAADEPIPAFDAIVGNFPYIGAARIEERQQGYLKRIARRLAEEWLATYPQGFTFPTQTEVKEFGLAFDQGLPVAPFLDRAQPGISAFADLYVSLFWHAAAFLAPGGRMGIVTSNAWLDVGYGYALQRFLLDHFKLVAVLESRCEPWFTQAAVNTVVTILERCDSAEERDAHPARFVKIKRPLADLIPWDMRLDAVNRWLGLDRLVERIEAVVAGGAVGTPHTSEDADFRVRVVTQGWLNHQLAAEKQTAKWGAYLRAPQVYFDLLAEAGDRLALLGDVAPPARGGTTRINEFFYVSPEVIKAWGIDPHYLYPLIKSPSESSSILIEGSSLNLKVFVCHKSKEQLRADGEVGTLAYIEGGEQQRYGPGPQEGMTWPEGPWVKDRKPGWYALPLSETKKAQVFMASAYGERHLHKYSPEDLIADKRLYFLSPVAGVDNELLAAVMNSSLTAFFTELAGRVSLGDGALELTVEDAGEGLRVPDARKFSDQQREAIRAAFQPLLKRPIGSVRQEIGKSDRQALDRAILEAMGLASDRWLTRIYDGLATLVGERLGLSQQRGQSRSKAKPARAAARVAQEVLDDLLPDGPKRFPDDFWSPTARQGAFRELILPAGPLRHAGHLFGKEELAAPDGTVLHVANRFELRYVLYAQANGHSVARLPEKPVEISRAVADYSTYLRELRTQLQQAYYTRTLDQKAAERFVGEAWRKLGLPEIIEER